MSAEAVFLYIFLLPEHTYQQRYAVDLSHRVIVNANDLRL